MEQKWVVDKAERITSGIPALKSQGDICQHELRLSTYVPTIGSQMTLMMRTKRNINPHGLKSGQLAYWKRKIMAEKVCFVEIEPRHVPLVDKTSALMFCGFL